jgi:uroporphyrin-III C-methyltransferase
MRSSGKVFICGAGPGDPKLITVKAMEVLTSCDIVLYDRLVSKEIIDLIPSTTVRFNVGRAIGTSTAHQDKTNILMVESARRGKKVLRLKGGDPFVFGRGGEEAEYLFEHKVDFEIIPGITSAIASAAYAGIPLTHRKLASSVAIVTGHEDPEKGEPIVNWNRLVDCVDTIVILMGVKKLESISRSLISAGMSKYTNVAIIENGTTAKQRIIRGSLSSIMSQSRKAKLKPPAIIIIGKVVSLQEKLAWFNG